MNWKILCSTKDENWAALVTRLTIGIVIFPHGAQKLFGWFGSYGFTGTKWIPEFANKDHKAHLLFDKVKDKVTGACGFCAGAFGVKEKIQELNFPLLNEYHKHPSLRSYVADGNSVITF